MLSKLKLLRKQEDISTLIISTLIVWPSTGVPKRKRYNLAHAIVLIKVDDISKSIFENANI